MKYVALLRGINVGGKSIVSMTDLKEVLSKTGFKNVVTYINSGNVIFEADKQDENQLEQQIELALEKAFFPIKVVALALPQLHAVVKNIPVSWHTNTNLRKYIAFVKRTAQPEDLIKEAIPKPGIDFLDKGPQVVYMTTKLEGITKSNLSKLNTKKIYQEITIRNYNTVRKLLDLMEK